MGLNTAFLFDLDGVIIDSESGYTQFWDMIGYKYLSVKEFCKIIKGQTLVHILGKYFKPEDYDEIVAQLDEFEQNMKYDFIPGAESFITALHEKGYRMAVVTSSNAKKMGYLYHVHPQLKQLFDAIMTSEDFTESKPSPQCFLRGMEHLGAKPECSIVFEDSINGLISARDSGAFVVGLTTTNPAEIVEKYADIVIKDFTELPEKLSKYIYGQ